MQRKKNISTLGSITLTVAVATLESALFPFDEMKCKYSCSVIFRKPKNYIQVWI